MIWFVKFLQKRPSDMTIRVWRVLFGLILVCSLYYNLIYNIWSLDTLDNNYFWIDVEAHIVEYIKYFFIWVWIVPIIMWVTNICLLKKKYIKIIQIIFGFLLFYISANIIPFDEDALDVDVLIWFMWILPIVAWITGKCITKSCLKYKEKITKIRV